VGWSLTIPTVEEATLAVAAIAALAALAGGIFCLGVRAWL
jgi:small basic protein